MTDAGFLFIDLETTGLDPARHCIVQIAAVAVSSDLTRILDRFHCLVHPSLGLDGADEFAMEINGYNEQVWKGSALDCSAALTRLELKAKGRRLAGHSIAHFDFPFLAAEHARHNLEPPPARPQPMCTRTLLRPAVAAGLLKSASLAPACDELGIELEHHDPISDVMASVEIARRVFKVWSHFAAQVSIAEKLDALDWPA